MKKKELMEIAEKLDLEVFKHWKKDQIEDAISTRRQNLLHQIEMDIEHHLKFGRSYFWNPPGNAANRRQMEEHNTYKRVINFGGEVYKYQSSVRVSCTNVYYSGSFYRGDDKKTVKLWRDLLLQIETIGV